MLNQVQHDREEGARKKRGKITTMGLVELEVK